MSMTFDIANKQFSWNILKADSVLQLSNPTITLDYTKTGGGNVVATSSNTNIVTTSVTNDKITIVGDETASGTAVVSIYVEGNENYKPSDMETVTCIGSNAESSYTYITIPTITNPTYTGSSMSPIVSCDSEHINVSGDTAASAVGDYQIVFSLKSNDYRWSDGTSNNKTMNWSIVNDDTVNDIKIVSWANGTDAEITAMVQAANEGKIDLTDYWNLGDERQVNLSAMSAISPLTDTHSAQTVTFVLMHQGLYDLVTPVLDKNGNTRTKCSFVVGMKHSLSVAGKMNSTATNSGSWNGCARRTWCNSTFRNAIPETLKPIFAQFKTVTAQTYNGSTNQISEDYFALPAEKEVFGTRTDSNQSEANALTQFWYYATGAAASNKKKKQGGNNAELPSGTGNYYWLRSPYSSGTSSFCGVNTYGAADSFGANYADGLAPFGCI